jgi:hypothetical protein
VSPSMQCENDSYHFIGCLICQHANVDSWYAGWFCIKILQLICCVLATTQKQLAPQDAKYFIDVEYACGQETRYPLLNLIFRTLASCLVSAQRPCSASASTSASTAPSPTPTSSALWFLFRWWPDKCKVNADCLIEKFGVV